MPPTNSKGNDYKTIKPAKKVGENSQGEIPSLSSKNSDNKLLNQNELVIKEVTEDKINIETDKSLNSPELKISYSEEKKYLKKQKSAEKDSKLLKKDKWIVRNGHNLTYAGIFLFTFFLFFRPYELIPGLGFLSGGASIIALATLSIYLLSQISIEGNLTILTTEVKCVLVMVFLSLLLIPISRDPALAWEVFNEPFIKAILVFILLVNVVRTRKRLIGLMWISFSISLYLSYTAVGMFQRGEFKTEDYRVSLDVKGIFENANEMAMQLVIMIPLLMALGLASKSRAAKILYFSLSGLFVAATAVTYSRGGFLALIGSTAVFIWKVGRNNRVRSTVIFLIVGLIGIILAPGNYGTRLLSIFIPGLDPVGSSNLRKENLILSIIVTIRNPWGIGIGNSPIFGVNNLQTHNAYTQVSSELGLLGLAAYLLLMISPYRKLGAIERQQYEKNEYDWFYYLSIGLQASIVAYMISSFFSSVAYYWFIYYLIAYAVVFRRIYRIENNLQNEQNHKEL